MEIKKNASSAKLILEHFKKEISGKPASINNHNNFKNGLIQHLENTFHIANKYFPNDELLHFMALIHDLGKARRYYWDGDEPKHTIPNVDHHFNTIVMLYEYGMKLTQEELNAIQFHHGGWSPFKGEMSELGIKLHFCDMMAVNIEKSLAKLK